VAAAAAVEENFQGQWQEALGGKAAWEEVPRCRSGGSEEGGEGRASGT